MEENKNIKHYTATDIQNYVEGKLSAMEMHAMEKAGLEDPFLADAIEGFENNLKKYSNSNVSKDVEELHNRLHERIDNKKKAILFSANRLWWQVAVSIIVLFGAGILTWYFFTNKTENKNIAQSSVKNNSDSVIVQNKKPATPLANDTISSKADVAVNKEKKKIVSSYTPEKKSSAKKKRKENLSEENNKNASADIASNIIKPSNETVTRKKDIQKAKDIPDSNSLAKSNNIPLDQVDFKNTFIGKVIDMNKNPISGATVRIDSKKFGTTTDRDGVFKLHFTKPDSTLKVTVSSIGFESTEATLINDNDIANNTINLKSNRSALSEVVVTGFGSRAKKSFTNLASDNTIKNAVPIIGWAKYKEYINKNKRLSDDSTGIKIVEVVSFTVKKNGKLSNFNIEQSYNDDYDEEAIRLIKEGPAWKSLKGKKTKATLTIEF